MPSCAKAASS